MECIFCKIGRKEMQADIVYETDLVLAFNDTHPKAPVHALVIPKAHIASVNDITERDAQSVMAMILAAPAVAKKLGVGEGYKLALNVGRKGGQVVDHLHLHLLGWPDGTAETQKGVVAV